MKYEFFEKVYDDEGDSKARAYFLKIKKWLSTSSGQALKQLKRMIEGSKFGKNYLVESGAGDQLLLESVGEIREAFGADEKKDKALTHTEELKKVFGSKSKEKGLLWQTEIKEAFSQ